MMEKIRADSAEIRLTPASCLVPLAPDAESAAAAIEAGADADIKMMRGSAERYYFSDRSMTEAYAKHLYRLAERDPVRLIADTTRDESKTYPRPTPVAAFLESPFSMTQPEIDAAIAAMASIQEYADIRTTSASNGALYLYSATHLGAAHADGLAEWIEVGQKENP